ncbi:hypothetical protein FB45DRAFT_912311 [Roridomyces roridus]|uniref:Transcription termination and cleavage factor C-terminal domain-containing protein n=1 Tax=Roridomyces roridus TaxID=1738132 RepID=A0AAD7BW09_9AGAR|nr:hypothetical protein FB45DRAFT_912311 [Roridomyces roridus]
MASASNEVALTELLLQLKKTTPAAARQILNNQPSIAYALIGLMVSMNAINIQVFQKTLSDFGAQTAPMPAPAPLSAIPPRLQPSQPSSRTNTPPTHNPYPPTSYGPPNPAYGRAPPRSAPDPLAAIPEDQRQMIMGVLSMTAEQINNLPPADRANIMHLRATLGYPSIT